MIRLLPVLAVVLLTLLPAFSQLVWENDWTAARQRAAREGKDLLMEFTGSDWCPPCISIRKNVFEREEFAHAAGNVFVLVEIDFPERVKQTEEVGRQNEQLEQRYAVATYPTIVFADREGRPYYAFSGDRSLEGMLAEIERANRIREGFAKTMAAIESSPVIEKYRLAGLVLAPLPRAMARAYYRDLVEELIHHDAANASGLAVEFKFARQEHLISELVTSLRPMIDKDPDAALQQLGDFDKQTELLPEARQLLYYRMGDLLVYLGRPDEAVATIRRAIDIMPGSLRAQRYGKVLRSIETHRDDIIDAARARKAIRRSS